MSQLWLKRHISYELVKSSPRRCHRYACGILYAEFSVVWGNNFSWVTEDCRSLHQMNRGGMRASPSHTIRSHIYQIWHGNNKKMSKNTPRNLHLTYLKSVWYYHICIGYCWLACWYFDIDLIEKKPSTAPRYPSTDSSNCQNDSAILCWSPSFVVHTKYV